MVDLSCCRVCLVHANNEKLIKIFESGGKLATEIFLISGVRIMEFTSYDVPALLCEGCLKDLKIALKFRNRARSSDKSFFRNASIEVEELNWDSKMVKLRGDDTSEPAEEDPVTIKCEAVVEEYLDPEMDLEDIKMEGLADMIIEDDTERNYRKYSDKIWKCEYCLQILSTKKCLEYHLKVKHEHEVSEIFLCEICEKSFPLQKALNRHLAQIHSIEQAIYECEECRKTFSSTRMLTIHVNKHHDPDVPGEFSCDLCGKIFNTRRKMKKHVNDTHNRKKRPKLEGILTESFGPCSVCGKFFKTRGQLTTHEKTHIPIKPTDYFYCDLCGNKFKAKSPLLTHIKLRHLAKIRFHCPECPSRSWSTKYALQNHIKVFHHNIRDFRCEWCGKGFGAKDKLTAHIRIHTGEQPFQCQFCGKKYTHQTDYIRHVWSHTGERRYTCQLCKQGYIKKSQLDSHRCPWKPMTSP